MIEVRPGTPEDAEAIADINVRSWQASFRGHFPDDFLDSLDPRDREPWVREVLTSGTPHHVAVAADDDQVVGFVILGPPFDAEVDPNKTIELYSLYIEPDRIGTGLGRTLMDYALAHLRAGQWTSAILWAPQGVERTCRFYESSDWVRDGTKVDEIPPGNLVPQVRYRIDLK